MSNSNKSIMYRVGTAILLAFVCVVFSSCYSPQKQFCEQAAQKMCERCSGCGDFKSCGLLTVSNTKDCIKDVERICAAYDSVYTNEVGNACLEQLDKVSCEELKKNGKPGICTRLF